MVLKKIIYPVNIDHNKIKIAQNKTISHSYLDSLHPYTATVQNFPFLTVLSLYLISSSSNRPPQLWLHIIAPKLHAPLGTHIPVCVLMCLLSSEGLSKAFEHTPQGSSVRSRGRALGVGTPASGRSPCELAAELSPEIDFLSSSADGGEPERTLERRDIERSKGESENEEIMVVTVVLLRFLGVCLLFTEIFS